jgi:hypothetical protein
MASLACNAPALVRPTETPVATMAFPSPSEAPPGGATPTPPADAYAPAFASYRAASVRWPTSFEGYSLPVELGTVQNREAYELSAQQLALLSENGFVVALPEPGAFSEFYQIYERYRYQEVPAFATVDSVLHVYHLLFDKLLRDLERDRFIPMLESLTSAMMETSQDQLAELAGTELEEPARRNLAFFTVAAGLLELDRPVPAQAQDMAQAELALIEGAAGAQPSPIWDREDLPADKKLIEDYSQYKPRGHYTRSEALKRYFKTMMWYGRMTHRLRDRFETQRALLVTHGLRHTTSAEGTPATELWRGIYEPTTFLVGKADDLSYFEYAGLMDSVFGADPDPALFADPAKMEAFMEASQALPPPQINSMWVWIWEDEEQATKGFRFMGQRFTIDAYVFEQLIWREVGTPDTPRGLPKALDFFAALGSKEALGILEEMGETEYQNYEAQMDKVRGQLAALEQDTWTENVYWSWLYALHPVIEPKDERFPEFMRTQAWTRKELNTALGSYTELKHDTILYAKQVMAEMGGGPGAIPEGYVEPNPEAYARLHALARMTRDGLEARGLLTPAMRANLENLMDLLAFLKAIAEKELLGESLTEEEYARIQFFGGELEALTIAASDCAQEATDCRDLRDQKAALIADVATGLSEEGPGLWALEEAIGQPAPILVVLPDAPRRLAVGAVFTYYEFAVPAPERMTDEAWQAQVEAGINPPPPSWTQLFMAP